MSQHLDFDDERYFRRERRPEKIRRQPSTKKRVYPCPGCKRPAMLTAKDVALSCKCQGCAEIGEGGT